MTESDETSWGDDEREVVRRERLLLDRYNRAQPAVVLRMLHPNFVEFGVSGQIWRAAAIVESLAEESPTARLEADGFEPARLART